MKPLRFISRPTHFTQGNDSRIMLAQYLHINSDFSWSSGFTKSRYICRISYRITITLELRLTHCRYRSSYGKIMVALWWNLLVLMNNFKNWFIKIFSWKCLWFFLIRYALSIQYLKNSQLMKANGYNQPPKANIYGEFLKSLISKQVIQPHFSALYIHDNKEMCKWQWYDRW